MKKLSAFFLLNSLFLTSDVRADNPPDFLVEAKFGLNVRQEPNQAGIIITTLPYGTFIEVIRRQEAETTIDGMHGHWAEIKAGNYQGWAFDAYLSPANPWRLHTSANRHGDRQRIFNRRFLSGRNYV